MHVSSTKDVWQARAVSPSVSKGSRACLGPVSKQQRYVCCAVLSFGIPHWLHEDTRSTED